MTPQQHQIRLEALAWAERSRMETLFERPTQSPPSPRVPRATRTAEQKARHEAAIAAWIACPDTKLYAMAHRLGIGVRLAWSTKQEARRRLTPSTPSQ